jgi:multidrug efflux pump subunit AcrA (membrane-fusion protein)
VTRIANALEPGTRTLLTEIDVPNPKGALTPGIYCTVELDIPGMSPALIVPASAIIFNQTGMQVAAAENGRAYLHKIGITTDFGTEVQVNEGINPGDKIILQLPLNLYNGEAVKISQSRGQPHPAD